MRASHTVLVKRATSGAKDAHGNAVEGFFAPEPLKVYSIAPKGSEEDSENRAAVSTGLALYMPHTARLGPHDHVVIDGEEWEIEGEIADYNRGPFGYRPGKVATLKRAEG